MSALRVIQTLSAGVDWLLPFVPPGVTLCDASGTRDIAVAEWVLAAILASTKMLPELRDRQREHRWEWRQSQRARRQHRDDPRLRRDRCGGRGTTRPVRRRADPCRPTRPRRRALGGRAGIAAGTGRDRRRAAAADAARPPGCSMPICSRACARARCSSTPRAGRSSTPRRWWSCCRRGACRAALDVTDPEPLPADHPLWDAPGVLITPHFAGDTIAADRRAFALVGEQVRRYVRGEPLANVVEHGY